MILYLQGGCVERVKLDQTNHDDRTFYIIESEPFINTFISVLKENNGFNCAVFTGGIMEAVLILSSFLTKVKVQSHRIELWDWTVGLSHEVWWDRNQEFNDMLKCY